VKKGPSLKIPMPDGKPMYKIDGDDATITEAEARRHGVSHSMIEKIDG
jgi:hypothetical protein